MPEIPANNKSQNEKLLELAKNHLDTMRKIGLTIYDLNFDLIRALMNGIKDGMAEMPPDQYGDAMAEMRFYEAIFEPLKTVHRRTAPDVQKELARMRKLTNHNKNEEPQNVDNNETDVPGEPESPAVQCGAPGAQNDD